MAGNIFRVLRLYFRRDKANRLRALAHEAEIDSTGLAAWVIAVDLWMEGDIAAAFRFAEKALRTMPTDFWLILICLTYYTRARDSTQIYAFAERLVAARNPAPQLRLTYWGESLFLWPLWLLGFRVGRNVKIRADNLDRWVTWAKTYLASHPRPIVAGGDLVTAERSVAEIRPGETRKAELRKATRLIIGIIYLILLIVALFYLAVHSVHMGSSDTATFATTACSALWCTPDNLSEPRMNCFAPCRPNFVLRLTGVEPVASPNDGCLPGRAAGQSGHFAPSIPKVSINHRPRPEAEG